jgi:hypothetical protein
MRLLSRTEQQGSRTCSSKAHAKYQEREEGRMRIEEIGQASLSGIRVKRRFAQKWVVEKSIFCA